jgi:hypothetical protein
VHAEASGTAESGAVPSGVPVLVVVPVGLVLVVVELGLVPPEGSSDEQATYARTKVGKARATRPARTKFFMLRRYENGKPPEKTARLTAR